MAPERSWESPRLFHPDLPHHLANDNLNVLVVDVNALLAVRLLDFLDQVVVDRRDPANPQDLMGETAHPR